MVDLDQGESKDGASEYKAMGLDPEDALFAVETPSGGQHLYFANWDKLPNTQDQLAPGIDTRGVGGLVFAPGSRTIFGEYRIKRGELSDLQYGCLTPVPEVIREKRQRNEKAVSQQVPGHEDIETIRDALRYVSSDCGYQEWADILMAIHHETGGSGLE